MSRHPPPAAGTSSDPAPRPTDAPGARGAPGWHRRARAAATEALGLLVPVECAGCGGWDQVLCDSCRAVLAGPLRRCEDDAPALASLGIPAWCVGAYAGPLRALVLAWKNHRRTDIAPAVLRAGRHAGREWAARLAERWPGPAAPGSGTLVVVPAPSGWRRRLARRLVVGDLAVAVGRGLAQGLESVPGSPPVRSVVVLDVLRRRGGPRHQAGLGARGRSAGRRGRVRAVVALPAEATVVLVDDVLTTGATLAECARALGPARVLGALVLAAAPAPGHGSPAVAPAPARGPSTLARRADPCPVAPARTPPPATPAPSG